MTYRREAPEAGGGWAAASWAAVQACGAKRLAAACGCGVQWIRKASNPHVGHVLSLERAVAADLACARAGGGLPHWEEYARRLRAAGVVPEALATARRTAAWRAAFAALRSALAAAERLLDTEAGGADSRGVAA